MYNHIMSSLWIEFDTGTRLRFDLENHAIAQLWFEKFQQRHAWPLDDARRFYGFKHAEQERQRAERDLHTCIETINSYQWVIDRPVAALQDQNTLNYLHHIFERYHGLLDQQHSQWWQQAPIEVQQALSQLNVAVHRMESTRDNLPRIVCTWFGMPKDSVLDLDLMHAHGTLTYEWGGVYLQYVEIGKTLEDLATDNDQWIGDDAFQPFRHYSADFNVRFYDRTASLNPVIQYWQQHRERFQACGINTWDHAAAFPYRFKIAQLRTHRSRSDLLAKLAAANEITAIYTE
jgi:hypothetical protein